MWESVVSSLTKCINVSVSLFLIFVCVLLFNTFDIEAVMNEYETHVLISSHKSGKKSGL